VGSSGQFIVRFTAPAGTLTIAKPSGGTFRGIMFSTTSLGVGEISTKEGEYFIEIPEPAANSASRSLPFSAASYTARWEQTGQVSDIPNGSSITFTLS
jgi:hypothetical protein